jgi:hypothetical protein
MGDWGAAGAYELTGTRTESYTRFSMTAKVTLICPWDSRYSIMASISQSQYPMPSGAGTYYYSAYPKSFEVSVYEEHGQATDVHAVTYSKAKIDVTYECKCKYNEEANISETITPILSMRRLPAWGFCWNSDGSPILDDESPAIMQYQIKITRQMTGVYSIIPTWFYDLAGCVNDATWIDKFTNHSYEQGTLLFVPSSLTKQITANPEDRDNIWDLGFELMWNPIGWNNFMRPVKGFVDYMVVNGQKYFLFEEKSFLFS